MYTFDPTPDDGSRDNQMRQAVDLIAKFPTIIAYAYNCYRHSVQGRGLHIRHPKEGLSLAENFLWMLRGDYTPMEARMLDLLMITQAEHGGGNNSTFTVRVTSSTQTDIYSSIAAGIGSLKGRLHGGANMMVADMFNHLRKAIKNWEDDEEIDQYLMRMLRKEAYDGSGLIYGLGHAVYTLSDPRAVTLKRMAEELAKEKGFEREFEFLKRIEARGLECIKQVHGNGRPICANLDFYSGFIYEMIGIPLELYTPIFAMSRIVGWCAHRLEELNFEDRRIIRPAYINVGGERKTK
jgi:citrate synthase